jgi:hypothetical protein
VTLVTQLQQAVTRWDNKRAARRKNQVARAIGFFAMLRYSRRYGSAEGSRCTQPAAPPKSAAASSHHASESISSSQCSKPRRRSSSSALTAMSLEPSLSNAGCMKMSSPRCARGGGALEGGGVRKLLLERAHAAEAAEPALAAIVLSCDERMRRARQALPQNNVTITRIAAPSLGAQAGHVNAEERLRTSPPLCDDV